MQVVETANTKKECAFAQAAADRSPQKFLCPPPKGADRIEDFEIVGSGTYGTAAIVDYTTRKSPDGGAMVMFVDPQLRWGVSRFGIVTDEATTATSDADERDGFRSTAEAYLDAIRTRDCAAYREHTFTEDTPRDGVP